MCRLMNHFIDNANGHPLSSLKFVLIEQVSIKTEEFLEQREGYWQAQLWTHEPGTDIHFLTVQVIHVVSPLQSLIFNVSQSHVSFTFHISTISG